MNASLHRTLMLLAESDSAEEASDKEWEERDKETPPADPENWEDVEASYEILPEDWEALQEVVESNSIGSLNAIQKAFLKEAGLIDDEGPTEFGKEWVEKVKRGESDDFDSAADDDEGGDEDDDVDLSAMRKPGLDDSESPQFDSTTKDEYD